MWGTKTKVDSQLASALAAIKEFEAKHVQQIAAVVCAECRLLFSPRSMCSSAYGPNLSNWAGIWHDKTSIQKENLMTANYSQTHCDRCAPKAEADKAAVRWATENPDKARVCMDKHKTKKQKGGCKSKRQTRTKP
jgi:hypothetical protein